MLCSCRFLYPSVSSFDMQWVLGCFSVDRSLPVSSCLSVLVWPQNFSSLDVFCSRADSTDWCAWKSHKISIFVKYSKRRIWHQQWRQSLRSRISPIWCLIRALAKALDLYLRDFIHCTAATWLVVWIIAWKCRSPCSWLLLLFWIRWSCTYEINSQ